MINDYQPLIDDDAIVDIYRRASQQAHGFLSPAFLEQECDNVRQIYLPQAQTLVAHEQTRLCGFIALLGHTVGGLFVDPDCQGKGLGQALVTAALQRQPVLELDVFEQNPLGRRFYDRFGFVELSRRHDDYTGQPVIKLRYETRG